jgi:C4-type Zn-finger protein
MNMAKNNDVHFNQACPVCGRTLHILVRLLGRRVYCQHCGGGFVAMDETLRRHAPPASTRVQPETVDALLERASRSLQQTS